MHLAVEKNDRPPPEPGAPATSAQGIAPTLTAGEHIVKGPGDRRASAQDPGRAGPRRINVNEHRTSLPTLTTMTSTVTFGAVYAPCLKRTPNGWASTSSLRGNCSIPTPSLPTSTRRRPCAALDESTSCVKQ